MRLAKLAEHCTHIHTIERIAKFALDVKRNDGKDAKKKHTPNNREGKTRKTCTNSQTMRREKQTNVKRFINECKCQLTIPYSYVEMFFFPFNFFVRTHQIHYSPSYFICVLFRLSFALSIKSVHIHIYRHHNRVEFIFQLFQDNSFPVRSAFFCYSFVY